jgi:hypothetical protein
MAGGEVARGGGRHGRRGRDGEHPVDGAGDQIAGAEGAVPGSEVEGEDDESLDEEGGGAVGAGGDGEGEDEEEDDQVSFAGFVG